jgi:subtilisin family serine protease
MATAHVTGTVALLLAKHPALTTTTVYQLLSNSTAHTASATGVIDSVDACAAVAALLGRGACNRSISPYSGVSHNSENHLGSRAISQTK